MDLFESDRLVFRKWELGFLGFAETLWGDPNVMTFIDVRGGLSREQIVEKVQKEMDCQIKNGTQYWPLFEKKTQEFVGCCGLKPWIHSAQKGPELGFHIIKTKWGLGYAKEAARRVVDFAFAELQVERILAGHHPKHLNSKKILEGLGFRFLEEVFFKPTGLYHKSYVLNREDLVGTSLAE